MLTDTDIEILNLARDVLTRLETDAGTESYLALSTTTPLRAAGMARLAEAASVADWALFQVFNVGRARARLNLTDEQVHNNATETTEMLVGASQSPLTGQEGAVQ